MRRSAGCIRITAASYLLLSKFNTSRTLMTAACTPEANTRLLTKDTGLDLTVYSTLQLSFFLILLPVSRILCNFV